jgi:hypothetical protein
VKHRGRRVADVQQFLEEEFVSVRDAGLTE